VLRALSAIVAALLLAGCGGGGGKDAPARDRIEAAQRKAAQRFAADGGVRETFLVTNGDAERVAAFLRQRATAFGLLVAVRATRDGRVVAESAAERADDARQAIDLLTAPGHLAFYDWERNVIGPRGRPAPADPEVTGGVSAGQLGGIPLAEAVERAAKRPAVDDGDNSHEGRWYALDRRRHRASGPYPTADDAAHAGPGRPIELRPGTVIVRAEQPDFRDEGTDLWYVLNDDVALDDDDILDPEQATDEGPGGGGQPMVAFKFTEEGRAAFERITRRIAERGARQQLPGTDAPTAANHFTIVLDDVIVSTPYIDFEANPDGIDASNGSQIEGGFTVESARAIASLLKADPLPGGLVPIGSEPVRGS
jgi:SecD/SecF fusion protein